MLLGILNLLYFRTKESMDPITNNESIKSRVFKFFKFYFIICIVIPIAFLIGFYIYAPFELAGLITEIFRTIGYKGVIIFYLLLFFLTESLFNIKLVTFLFQVPMVLTRPSLLRKERRKKRLIELKENLYGFLYGMIRISLKMALIIAIIDTVK
ncbi:hypothetical protein [Adhaeribacter rhizoryzae]|uniref:Uncharacterized protein n=1 Tax=Adhaeribacter rhizoryzae TaxID=2607907 RepID=A0A5M6DFI1_9BACT|nr:hypothetical protein [Adhaeribacter rhizoryzae]KAA5543955.1 hypothetical protein F0145_15355 [Adhaeribacter rhizoryzae]